jgi:site-specific DNA-methyltransferase (adenine-specific)
MKNDVKIVNGECIAEMQKLKDASVDLVIADPPYWKVIGQSWDYQWRTEHDYVAWSLQWMSEVSRILRFGGTFYMFGYFRILALLVPHLESMGLELRQQIIVDKGMRSVSGRATKNYKMFPTTTESILFIIKDNKQFIKPFLKGHQAKLGLSSKEINEMLGVKSNGGGMWSIYTGKNVCEQFPTREIWEKLEKALMFDLEYESVAQTFHPEMGLTDVWRDVDFYKESRIHPTQKPAPLIKRLVLASSNRGDFVVDPFAGSGSTAVVASETERNCLAIEIDEEYCNSGRSRLFETCNSIERGTNERSCKAKRVS